MRTVSPEAPVRQRNPVVRRRKLIAVIFAAVPSALFALFAMGEGIGSEPGWWGHLIQLALVAIPTVLAWFWPKVGGPALITAGVVLAIVVLVTSAGSLAPSLLAVAVFSLPLVIAGVLFTRLGYAASKPGPGDHLTE